MTFAELWARLAARWKQPRLSQRMLRAWLAEMVARGDMTLDADGRYRLTPDMADLLADGLDRSR